MHFSFTLVELVYLVVQECVDLVQVDVVHESVFGLVFDELVDDLFAVFEHFVFEMQELLVLK